MADQEELVRLLNQIIRICEDLKMEMQNIRKALENIDETIQSGFDLEWPEEE